MKPVARALVTEGRARLLLALLSMGLLAGCTFTNIDLEQDDRLEIVAPDYNANVKLPFTIRWNVNDFTITPPNGDPSDDAGYFALFFDRAPVAPGQKLESIAADDEACVQSPKCPGEKYLNQRHIYTTTETSLNIKSLPDIRPSERPETDDRHGLTIILLNGANERIGESSFYVEFIVDRSP